MARMTSAGRVLAVAALIGGMVVAAAHADASNGSPAPTQPPAKHAVAPTSPAVHHSPDS